MPVPGADDGRVSSSNRVWRAPLALRILFTLIAAFMVGGALMPWDDGVMTIPPDGSGDYRHDVGFRLLLVAMAVLLLACVHRARMDLGRDDVVMRYTFSSRRIPLSQITRVTAGRDGLSIETGDGASCGSPMFIGEKAPIASWLRRTTRADSIAETIMRSRP